MSRCGGEWGLSLEEARFAAPEIQRGVSPIRPATPPKLVQIRGRCKHGGGGVGEGDGRLGSGFGEEEEGEEVRGGHGFGGNMEASADGSGEVGGGGTKSAVAKKLDFHELFF